MKTVPELNQRRVPIVRIDASLEQYHGKTIFPEKLAKANAMLKTAKLPRNRHHE